MLFDGRLVGLSYHLLTQDGAPIRWDNRRTYLQRALRPGEAHVTEMVVDAPQQPGRYQLELDVVWEGVAWLKDQGLATVHLDLVVT
jgi:hypothetical protein